MMKSPDGSNMGSVDVKPPAELGVRRKSNSPEAKPSPVSPLEIKENKVRVLLFKLVFFQDFDIIFKIFLCDKMQHPLVTEFPSINVQSNYVYHLAWPC